MEASTQLLRKCFIIAGIAGGILMLTGDMLFYSHISSGKDFHPLKVMSSMPVWRLALGGFIGPIAAILYSLGAVSIYLTLKPFGKQIALFMCICLVIMFLNGGAYHAVYANYGFAAAIPDAATSALMISKIRALHDYIYDTSFVTGITATILFFYLVLCKNTAYPKWIVLIFPTLISLLEGIAIYVPYPIGGIVSGSWTNGWFIIFFIVSGKIIWNNPVTILGNI